MSTASRAVRFQSALQGPGAHRAAPVDRSRATMTEKKETPAQTDTTPQVRLLSPADSLEEITGLLHRAYRAQVEMGLRPLAGRQDVETTRKRCSSGECYVAVLEGRLVGVILFHEVEDSKGPPWFQRPEVDSFSQFAVDPDVQGKGIGRILLDTVERRAAECGSSELGLSMAEPDTKLMEFYLKRGYRLVEHWQWPYTNYRSAILSKTLG